MITYLFPAHAGVIPLIMKKILLNFTIPRTRGGDPHMITYATVTALYSPHTRG